MYSSLGGSVRGSCGALNSFLARHEEELQLATENLKQNEHLLEYETLELRVNPPNVTVDNNSDEHATLLTVDSANRPGTLVEVVQYLTELDLVVKRARISSDGGWFVDEFHVTDRDGQKLADPVKLEALRQICQVRDDKKAQETPIGELATVFELSGADRPGLLSDVTALLARHGCNVVTAAVWTHWQRVALILMCQQQGSPVRDEAKLARLRELLVGLLRDEHNEGIAITGQSAIASCNQQVRGRLHPERRLHQLLLNEDMPKSPSKMKRGSLAGISSASFESQGSEMETSPGGGNSGAEMARDVAAALENGTHHEKPEITVKNCMHTGYTVLRIMCSDRPSLLFDTVCTLSDMQCDVYHATIDSAEGMACQEYYVRSRQGVMISSLVERDVLRGNLLAAIQRRMPEGLRVEVCCGDRPGLLADISRVLREAGLSVSRADVRTLSDGRASEIFYVTDAAGRCADRAVVEAACRKIGGRLVDEVKPRALGSSPGTSPNGFSFALLRNWSEVWNHGGS